MSTYTSIYQLLAAIAYERELSDLKEQGILTDYRVDPDGDGVRLTIEPVRAIEHVEIRAVLTYATPQESQ